uniref:Uncharacterized protein n=1 Tax=Arundo donax TaxID=35708 RepID=A0A0A9FFD2_ARUDO
MFMSGWRNPQYIISFVGRKMLPIGLCLVFSLLSFSEFYLG